MGDDVWRDSNMPGRVHGVVSNGGRSVRTVHRGRTVQVDVTRDKIRIRSTFPDGVTAERLIDIPVL
jgi:hypothetical protein